MECVVRSHELWRYVLTHLHKRLIEYTLDDQPVLQVILICHILPVTVNQSRYFGSLSVVDEVTLLSYRRKWDGTQECRVSRFHATQSRACATHRFWWSHTEHDVETESCHDTETSLKYPCHSSNYETCGNPRTTVKDILIVSKRFSRTTESRLLILALSRPHPID